MFGWVLNTSLRSNAGLVDRVRKVKLSLSEIFKISVCISGFSVKRAVFISLPMDFKAFAGVSFMALVFT